VAVLQLPLGVTGSVLHAVGVSATVNERLWVTVLFAAVAMAMAGLLLVLGLGATAAVVGGLVYGFSPYVLAMSGMDVAYLAAMAVVPGLVAWVLWVARPGPWSGKRMVWAVGWLVLAAGALGLVAGSPPLLLTAVAALVGAVLLVGWLEGRAAMGRALRRAAAGTGLLAVVCAYWAVPFGLELASSTMVSAASHRSWQWAATRSTLANSFWLNTSWDWADRSLFPYAGDFHHFPLVLWRYVVPVVAFAAVGMAGWQTRTRHDQQRLRLLVAATTLALVVVVLATGSRAPGAPLFGLLTAIPDGWLVQDPGRFLFVAGAAYAVLVAVLVDHRLGSSQQRTRLGVADQAGTVRVQPKRWLVPVGLCLVMLLPAYPLLTGGVEPVQVAGIPRVSNAADGAVIGDVDRVATVGGWGDPPIGTGRVTAVCSVSMPRYGHRFDRDLWLPNRKVRVMTSGGWFT